MKKILFILVVALSFVSCNDNPSEVDDVLNTIRKQYLVEKITWYDNETNHKEAYYEYDSDNRLVRRTIHSTYFEQGRVKYDTIIDNYEYTRGNFCRFSSLSKSIFSRNPVYVYL